LISWLSVIFAYSFIRNKCKNQIQKRRKLGKQSQTQLNDRKHNFYVSIVAIAISATSCVRFLFTTLLREGLLRANPVWHC